MRHIAFLLLLFTTACSSPYSTSDKSIRGVMGKEAMVVTAHPLATQVGLDILEQGGNAYDAAAAVHFALAVVYPRAGNIGGGGFMVTRTYQGDFLSLDFREKAPGAATTNMYLDEEGNPISALSRQGYLAVGVPGSVAGISAMHEEYGELDWSTVVLPAIKLAANGYSLTTAEAKKLNDYQSEFSETNPNSQIPFLNQTKWVENDVIKIPALSETLKRISSQGSDGFYAGETANKIAEAMKENNGLLTTQDLTNYSAKWRLPVESNYKQYNVVSMPPPSSGGVAVLQLIEGVEQNQKRLGKFNSAKTVHLYTELERRVYADRASYLGDPDYFEVPVDTLISDAYMKHRTENISWSRATSSQEIKEGKVDKIESVETTHYSIIDPKGNAVAITTTLNGNYGSKVFLDELGFFLNNEMDDFSAKPGVPNMFGLVGAEANKIEPGKRMLSSMTPTIVEKNDELFMVVGTPGGSTIITSVFQTIMNVVEFKMNMQQAVNAKKVHHQWLPDRIIVEKGAISPKVRAELLEMGHLMEEREAIGRVDAILVHKNGLLEGAADPRGDDLALGF